MSDSDIDLLPNNVFTFQNESTTVSARGPNINTSNLTGLSFRNIIMTPTMNMARNFESQKYLKQSCDQRSMYYRRDTSPPMSLYSASSFKPRNYQDMYLPRGMTSQRSLYGRSGSSMRSIDSNATVSAADIAMAFKNMNFNNYDLRIIKDAYNQFMKRRMRRKIEKRRNLRLSMKGHRRRSGYDSGELGSESSISSDECRSTRTAHTSVYRDNMTSCKSTKTDFSDFRSVQTSNLYKDCTESFRQNTFKNMLGVAPRNSTAHTQSRVQNAPPVTQKDRFKSGFLLPSQRFNQSVASVAIPEKQTKLNSLVPNQRNLESCANALRNSSDLESEQEEMFSEITIREKSVYNADFQSKTKTDARKRCLEVDDVRPINKRSKLSSPPKKNVIEVPLQKEINNIEEKNEFEFLKPQFPVRKCGNIKVKEKLLAKSAEPLVDTVICANTATKPQTSHPHCDGNREREQAEMGEQQSDLASISDISMRPRFIKRKLNTQNFDVLEIKNTSSDNLASPQSNVYSAIQKEKHKARKLVTNQSCLSRNIREDNNLLDLIHKIVPPDRRNVTNVTNKSELANNSTKNKADEDKWDITSVITTCNNDDVSDSYTDEEIFINESSRKQVGNKENSKKNIRNAVGNEKKELACKTKLRNDKKKESPDKKKSPIKKKKDSSNKKILASKKKSPTENKSPNKMKSLCQKEKDLVEKLSKAIERLTKEVQVSEKPDNKKIPEKKKSSNVEETRGENKRKVYSRVKSFWDTDSESDVEGIPSAKKVREKENNVSHGNYTLKEKPNLNQSNVMESKNTSSDNLASPQSNVYSAIQKGKHKARMLVTNQSCLSRNAVGNEKIPAEKELACKTKLQNDKKKKWPIKKNKDFPNKKKSPTENESPNKMKSPCQKKKEPAENELACKTKLQNDSKKKLPNKKKSPIKKKKHSPNKKKSPTENESPNKMKSPCQKKKEPAEKELACKAKLQNDKKKKSPKKKTSPIKMKKESPNKNKLASKKKSPTENKSPNKMKSPCQKKNDFKVIVEKLANKAIKKVTKKAQVSDNLTIKYFLRNRSQIMLKK